jgi:hypothetical protein
LTLHGGNYLPIGTVTVYKSSMSLGASRWASRRRTGLPPNAAPAEGYSTVTDVMHASWSLTAGGSQIWAVEPTESKYQ